MINKGSLTKEIKRNDVSVALEANFHWTEYAMLARYTAQQLNMPMWSHGIESHHEQALFSVDNDYRAIGIEIGKQVIKVISEKKKLSEIPVKLIKSSRSLLINETFAAKKNYPLTKKLKTQLEQSFAEHEDLETICSLIISPNNTCFTKDTVVASSYNMRLCNDAHLHHEILEDFLVSNNSYETSLQLYHIASLVHSKAVIVVGEKQARLIHDHFKRHQVQKPIICLANQHEQSQDCQWHTHGKSYGVPVVKVTIPPPSLHDMFNLLIAAKPDLEYIYLISGITCAKDQPQHLHNQIERLKFLAHKHDKKFRVIHAPHEEYLNIFPLSFLRPGNGFLVCTESIPARVMRTLGERFTAHNIPAVAGSLTWARWFPLNIGIDANAMTDDTLIPILKRLLIEKRFPKNHTISLDYMQWYYACINEPLAQNLSLNVNAARQAIAQYKYARINHAEDIATCMGQFTVEERLHMIELEKSGHTIIRERITAETATSTE